MAKILPFPRDWFGPIEELVPVFPEPDAAPVISAASFWDEDAGAVHQAVESPLDRRWVGASGGSEVDGPLVELAPHGPDAVPAFGNPRRRRRARAAAKLGAGVGVAAVCAAVALLLLTGGLRHPLSLPATKQVANHAAHRKPVAAIAPQPTVTEPTVTVVTSAKPPVKRARRPRRSTAVTHRSAASAPTRAAARSTPAVSTHLSSGSAPAAGSGSASPAGRGCVRSPDSGCLP
jgi:hypothetical protein